MRKGHSREKMVKKWKMEKITNIVTTDFFASQPAECRTTEIRVGKSFKCSSYPESGSPNVPQNLTIVDKFS